MKFTPFLTLFPLVLALPSPSKVLAPRAQPSQCGAFTSIATGPFTIYANEWGASTSGTTGSQCSYIDSLSSGNSLAWHTTWTWAGSSSQVKTYTNVETSLAQKAVSQYKSIPTTWTWNYTGTNLACNVAYDTFLGTTATSTNLFEVMVWLGVYGGVSPLSANGYPFTPIASPTINGVAFDLAYGTNGAVKVYSFVAHSHAATPFSGDLLAFYKYLSTNYGSNGFTSNLVLQSVQAGSEVFTGSGAELATTGYTISAS
ncbi:glycoside hydrolase family 12 protein [Viridothelium virens]|uniref:Glycoside hydrolase family 12 protein n=1 Tax=Viridothelium virens TaxID=1048519 RepID=A0A6A6GY84_VIRVR|nr:glycoside hydrolase family 12 protein [Viridothelium virens]